MQVSVLDVFDNREYVQLVMEKFGAGLDLFEFIEREPVLHDPLAAHIFAQVKAGAARPLSGAYICPGEGM